MKCPNCSKEMKDKSYVYYGMADWDMDYPATLHEEYWCSDCRIKFINDDWVIPESMIATEKQMNAGRIIESNTGIIMPPPTKKLMWKYIQDNMELSKKMYEENKIRNESDFDDWCLENSDWLPEYF